MKLKIKYYFYNIDMIVINIKLFNLLNIKYINK